VVDESTQPDKTDRSAPQDGINASERAALRLIITGLLKTAKDITFYPANSPVIEQSLDRAVSLVTDASAIMDPIVFEVGQHEFTVGGIPLLDQVCPEQEFAAELFGLGIRALEIHAGTTAQEIHAFLAVVNDAHRSHSEFEYLTDRLEHARVSGITVLPAARLDTSKLVDGPVLGEQEPGGLYVSAVGAETDDDSDRIGRVLTEFASLMGAAEDEADLLLEHIRETDCLTVAADELSLLPDAETIQPIADRLFGLITETARLAQHSPPGVRRGLLDELSKAVDTMDAELRNTFFTDLLTSGAGLDSATRALLSRLSDETLATELADTIILHGGAEAAVQTYFVNVQVPVERRNAIIDLAYRHVGERDRDSEGAEKLFSDRPSADTVARKKEGSARADVVFSKIASPDIDRLALTDEQNAEIERAVQTALDTVVQHNARTVLALLEAEQTLDGVERIVEGLETLRARLLQMPGGIEPATEIVEGYIEKRRTQTAAGQSKKAGMIAGTLDRAINAACSSDSLTALLERTVRCDKNSPEYQSVVGYLNALGNPGYRMLVDRLRNESVRSRRMAARTLVVSIGDPCIELLAGNIANEQWYVIRNVAAILGDMRSSTGTLYLSQALKHADRRVRHEAVNSLGKIGSGQAARTLATVLSRDDIETAQAAVRWLGMLGSVDAVSDLVRLMDSLGNSSAERQLKLSIVDALTQIGSPLALASLERVERARKWFFFKKDSILAQAAARAVKAIRERVNYETQ